MADRLKVQGQTLVEMAVVLPILGLAIAAGIQLIVFCHNMITLQLMAANAVRQISAESPMVPPDSMSHLLWGQTLVVVPKSSRQTIQPWRPFWGKSTVQSPGCLVLVTMQTTLLPGPGFGRFLPLVRQAAAAETLFEPPRPSES
jgi:hypothetical protein